MAKTKLLIFPLDMDDADTFLRVAGSLGMEIVGASSAMADAAGKAVDAFLRLPFVTDPEFDEALRVAIEQHGIARIYSPHQGIWRHLDDLRRKAAADFPFTLCNPDPFTATRRQFSPHDEWAAAAVLDPTAERIAGDSSAPPLPCSCYAALHRQFLGTPGQCDESKLQALCNIARILPRGDLLEVGSLYGRSAFALGYLASRHRLGSVICIDPWNTSELTDQGPQAAVLNSELVNPEIDVEQIFRIFLSTVALLDNVGYLRRTSTAASAIYRDARSRRELHSPGLGNIPLADHLALLHIDGNHRYDHVRNDVDTWSPYLVTGGWLLLDDYLWAFGDGPRRVGDELLSSPLYDRAFVSGDTLFLRRSEAG
ncbi:MAG TPA: class I SAM-dependent methyltransferase [Accumulibacter sp.]|uniref:class I SAM-dependent methyltransferase n=1 Tax=Accumulibacter sp. TaxID=2053492 RepID=UPI0025E3C397|nr:class I SAM-dependent methyltransferase [Accumulibacter sp.]MCM8600249.1 class I SAM-dependent methyltransferase [Accumulibacter sp.]MCM8664493.1 class I SAM-dependent methyltransferase [Accumulibacter sp.]HNC51505.1 class I SAM-dependent methyltransferase [Accumulibacter sp.]